MGLQAVWLLAAAVAALRMVAGVDLFCDCAHRGGPTVALHCDEAQAGNTNVTCHKVPAPTVPDVPRGYKFVSGYSVVKLYRTFKNWSAAKESCEADGSRLAVPPDRYALDGLKSVFGQEKGIWYAFLGFSDDKQQGSLDANLTLKPSETRENCSILRSDGVMGEARCDSMSPFLCERPLSLGVPGTYKWEEDAGRFYKTHARSLPRARAAEECRRESATLAVPDTWLRAAVLLRLLEPSADLYYVGFTDHEHEGDFVTDAGRHLSDMEFQLWAPDQPNNNDGGAEENCLALSVKGYSDVRCDLKLLFVCEILPE
ncbi:uncharacterized protein LOC126334699 [Schistocerca gregaria]|uniref:uncharacterized protein LOC126334699 n=1 Tax=Schistocerca gregaria TaxID=7010 RepID=UPI00211EAB84|nr:uncharacterized protein LOC126334699 [Schistocerca gregaria]